MPATIDADLLAKLNKGASSPVYLVELQLHNSASGAVAERRRIYFCTGDRPLRNTTSPAASPAADYRIQKIIPNIVLSVGEVSQELDAIKRSCSISNTSIVLSDDGTIRDIMADPGINSASYGSLHLFGQKVNIYLGVQDLDISKFISVGSYLIDEIVPRENTIELECRSVTSLLSTIKFTRNFIARGPYAQMDQILRHGCALVDAQYDRDSVDPYWDGIPANELDRRHFSLRRATEVLDTEFLSSSKGVDGVDAWSLIGDLCYITGGFIQLRYNGKLTYTPWDPDKSTTRHLTTSDITDFAQETTYSNAVNRVTHTVTADKLNITYDPFAGQSNTSQPATMPTQQAAYFGGNNADTKLTLEADSSAEAFANFDSSSLPADSPFRNKRYLESQRDLSWESGMSYATWLMAPTITYSGSKQEKTHDFRLFIEGPTVDGVQLDQIGRIKDDGSSELIIQAPFRLAHPYRYDNFKVEDHFTVGDTISTTSLRADGINHDVTNATIISVEPSTSGGTSGQIANSIKVASSGTATSGSSFRAIDSNSALLKKHVSNYRLGTAIYNHSTKQVTLSQGHLNTVDSGSRTYIDPNTGKGKVIRIVPRPQDLAAANNDKCVFKEARITGVTNPGDGSPGNGSIITVADDQVLEFTQTFSQGYDFEILDPEQPVDNQLPQKALSGNTAASFPQGSLWPGVARDALGLRERYAGDPVNGYRTDPATGVSTNGFFIETIPTTGFSTFASNNQYLITAPNVVSFLNHFNSMPTRIGTLGVQIRVAFTTATSSFDIPLNQTYDNNASVVAFSPSSPDLLRINAPSGVSSNVNLTEAGELSIIFAGIHVYDTQRYFYVQYAAHTGFAGANYGPGAFELNAESVVGQGWSTVGQASREGPGPYVQRGPGWSADLATNPPYAYITPDLKHLYGHGSVGTHFSQTRGSEWHTNNYPSAGYKPRYTYIKLASEAQRKLFDNLIRPSYSAGKLDTEILRCNLAYPCSAGFSTLLPQNNRGIFLSELQEIHRHTKVAKEPRSAYTGKIGGAAPLASCAVFRADAESVSRMPYTTMGWVAQRGGGLKVSGRGALGSKVPGSVTESFPGNAITTFGSGITEIIIYDGKLVGQYFTAYLQQGTYWAPEAWTKGVGSANPDPLQAPNLFFMGIKATDVTCAAYVNQRILDRCSEGMPILRISIPLEHIELEVGDFISLDNDVYLRKGSNGAASNDVFEITRKEIFLEEDSPRIELQLAWVRETTLAPIVATAYVDVIADTTPPVVKVTPIVTIEGVTVVDTGGSKVNCGSYIGQ